MNNTPAGRMTWVATAVLILSPTIALALMRSFPGTLDPALMWSDFHFWASGVTALASAIACVFLVAAARTLRETRLLFLTLAFLTIGGVFSVHGLLTPGVVKHEFHVALAVSAWISVLGGASFAALSVVDLPERAERVVQRAGLAIFAWVAVAVGAYIAISWTFESWLNEVPTDDRQVQYVVAATAFALFGFAAWRYAQAWFFARLPSQFAMTAALVLLLQIPPILLWGEVWHASWWTYHFAYGAAFAVLFTGWGIEYGRRHSLSAIADALAMRDALVQLDRGRHKDVIELVDAIEAKDYYTVGHVHRVGTYAYEIGRRMGLSPGELRDVVLASQMHDVGKIATPDAVLLKPGKLTEAETAEMRKHSIDGGEIAARVGALRAIAPAVRAHHERFDGNGYPDGLRGEEIPLASRICAVADTYDAMTSTRPYRNAMGHEAAIAEIQRVCGTQLDPRCVDAFLSIFDKAEAA